MGQTYAGLGVRDPRLAPHRDTIYFSLTSLQQSWTRTEDPPSRVKPLPGTLLQQTVHLARLENTPASLASASTLTLGFFFLLRLSEYVGTPNDALDTLFRLRDLTLCVGSRALSFSTCPLDDIRASTFATLTFTRQKNGVRNETIGHGRSDHPQLCPVLCLVDRVLALRAFNAAPATPLHAYRPTEGAAALQCIQSRDLRIRRSPNPKPRRSPVAESLGCPTGQRQAQGGKTPGRRGCVNQGQAGRSCLAAWLRRGRT